MARSLTIMREETATTSPLLTGFLVISVCWLLLSAMSGYATDTAAAPQNGTTVIIAPR
ncbi:MAG: hypothetical protein GWP91_01175 [Rhodobacterales bacterium]|nr:hypothetical protein [Rhodobacterales bacterium]